MLWWTLRQLGSGSVEARVHAAEQLASSRETRVVEALVMALADQEAVVRAAAASALGKIGDPQATEPLVAALLDASSSVRAASARALKSIGWKPGDERQRAMVAIAEDQWDSLSSFGDSVVELLLGARAEGDEELKQKATQALTQVAERRTIAPLLTMLRDGDLEIKHMAILALGQLGDESAVEPLLSALFDPTSDLLRVAAARALGQLGDPQVLDPLMAAREDKQMPVRVAAIRAIGQIGGPEAIKRLISSLGHPYQEVRSSAVQMLAKIGEPAVEPVMAAVQDRRLRETALQALEEIGEPAVEALLEATNEPQRREMAVQILQRIGARAVKPLVGLTLDPFLRDLALRFLVQMGNAAIEPLIEAAQDPQLREHAFRTLQEIGVAVLDPLVRILNSLPSETGQIEGEERLRADVVFDVLVQFGAPAAPALAATLKHPSVYIRRRAVRALGLLGDAASVRPLLEVIHDKHVAKNVVDSLRQIMDRSREYLADEDLHTVMQLHGIVQFVYTPPNNIQPVDVKAVDCTHLQQIAAQELQRRGVVA